jgi:hypothetical protein
MKQSLASAARLQGGGPILGDGAGAVVLVGLPPPRIMIGDQSCQWHGGHRNLHICASSYGIGHGGCRNTTPCGTSPVLTIRQSAMRVPSAFAQRSLFDFA